MNTGADRCGGFLYTSCAPVGTANLSAQLQDFLFLSVKTMKSIISYYIITGYMNNVNEPQFYRLNCGS